VSEQSDTLIPGDPTATDEVRSSMPFAALCGIVIDSSGPDEVVGRIRWRDEFCTVNGNLHGGYLMALGDALGAWLAVQHLPEGAGTSTISSATNFLRPAPEGDYTIRATLVMAGRRTITVVTDVLAPSGKVVSRTTQTQAVLTF
jgi:uncharacterized protein (TIGR00369 family)